MRSVLKELLKHVQPRDWSEWNDQIVGWKNQVARDQLDPSYPSRLTLPIVPGLKAEAPSPACGSMEFQPCRMAPKPPMTSSAR